MREQLEAIASGYQIYERKEEYKDGNKIFLLVLKTFCHS